MSLKELFFLDYIIVSLPCNKTCLDMQPAGSRLIHMQSNPCTDVDT